MRKLSFFFSAITIIMLLLSCQTEPCNTFTDTRDGQQYKYVTIGSQTWMAENLRYKPESGVFWAYDDKESRADTFGYLYDFERACNVCPEGWHLPGRAEWDTLVEFLGGSEEAGLALKAADPRWKTEDMTGYNSSGFSALPEGVRRYDGRYSYFNRYTYFWSATDGRKDGEAWCYALDGPQKRIFRISWAKDNALSVRCIKDSGAE